MAATHLGNTGLGANSIAAHELADGPFALFKKPQVDTSILEGNEVLISPVTNAVGDGPIEFVVPAEGANRYAVLSSFKLRGFYRLVKIDGTALTPRIETVGSGDAAVEKKHHDPIACINMAPHSFFKAVDLTLGSTQLTDLSSNTYPYRAYLETMLSYSKAAKASHLTNVWVGDDGGEYDSSSAEWNNRIMKTRESAKNHFEIPVICDLFQSNKNLVAGIDLSVKFIRSPPEFYLMGAEGDERKYKVELHDLRMSLYRVTVNPSIITDHQRLIKSQPMYYPTLQVKIKTYSIAQGQVKFNLANVFRGSLPTSVIVGLVRAKSFSGQVNYNPFNFEHFKLSLINLRVNGRQFPACEPFRPKYTDPLSNKHMGVYHTLMRCVGVDQTHLDNGVTPEMFTNGSALYGFDMTPDQCNNYHIHPTNEGVLDIDIELEEDDKEAITVLVYATFNSVVTIDEDNNVECLLV